MTQDQPDRRRRLRGRPRRALVGCVLGVAALTTASSATGAGGAPAGTITPPWGFTLGGDRIAISGANLSAATFTQVAAGGTHTIALAADGTLYGWGSNEIGQLGNGEHSTNEELPVKVDMSGALKDKKVIQIAAGQYHSLALTDDGKVYGWGINSEGQLGTGTDRVVPLLVPTATDQTGALAGKHVAMIASGDYHTMALTQDGLMFAWGWNLHGQIGHGNTSEFPVERPTPVTPPGSVSVPVTHIDAGAEHSLAISEGTLYAWGRGTEGQLGNNVLEDRIAPTRVLLPDVPAARTASATAAGAQHTLIALSDGQAYATGTNDRGQLGIGSFANTRVPAPVVGTGAGGTRIASVAAGPVNGFAVGSDGGLFAWGDNKDGQLGNGALYTQASTPVAVDRTGVWQGKPAAQVSAGTGHAAALDAAGQAHTWGANNKGQLGDGYTAGRTRPVHIRTHLVHFGAASGPGSLAGLDVVLDIAAGTISTTTPAHAPGDVDVFVTALAE